MLLFSPKAFPFPGDSRAAGHRPQVPRILVGALVLPLSSCMLWACLCRPQLRCPQLCPGGVYVTPSPPLLPTPPFSPACPGPQAPPCPWGFSQASLTGTQLLSAPLPRSLSSTLIWLRQHRASPRAPARWRPIPPRSLPCCSLGFPLRGPLPSSPSHSAPSGVQRRLGLLDRGSTIPIL